MARVIILNSPQMNNVLVVEDGLIIALHIQKLLSSRGYNVVGKLKYGEEVEEAVRNLDPNLIIMDIMLEGDMTGIGSAHNIRKFSDIPIIFMSALTDPETMSDVTHISNSIKMNKPFEEESFVKAINGMLQPDNV